MQADGLEKGAVGCARRARPRIYDESSGASEGVDVSKRLWNAQAAPVGARWHYGCEKTRSNVPRTAHQGHAPSPSRSALRRAKKEQRLHAPGRGRCRPFASPPATTQNRQPHALSQSRHGPRGVALPRSPFRSITREANEDQGQCPVAMESPEELFAHGVEQWNAGDRNAGRATLRHAAEVGAFATVGQRRLLDLTHPSHSSVCFVRSTFTAATV